jgi:adenylate cyclase
MSFWTDLRLPAEHELLIGFYDLTGFMPFVERAAPMEVLAAMAGYFAFTGKIVHAAGGRLIKTMGDAGLAAFPAAATDDGVRAFEAVQQDGDAWLVRQGYRGRAHLKLHVGPVAVGLVGAPGEERLDVYGKTVNVAAVLESHGLAMTPAVFRRLPLGTRTRFKKHTPPVTYVALEDAHGAYRARSGGSGSLSTS